ncbi:MAG: 50S ribosomal protein L15, partial [Candidatus Nealsonbacteria bacterium]
KRIGRGGKRGTYSGRGIKGQKARAGRKIRPQLRDIIKKIPKKRGYRFKSFRQKPAVVNVAVLEQKFKDGDKITPQKLLEAGLIKRQKGKLPAVKLLGTGTLTRKLLVSECQFSKSAAEKIKKAGGSIIK